MRTERVWGRSDLIRRANEALAQGNNVVVAGAVGVGTTRFLSAVAESLPKSPMALVCRSGASLVCRREGSPDEAVEDASDVDAVVARAADEGIVVVIDDLDRFDAALVEAVVDAVLRQGARLIAAMRTRPVSRLVDERMTAALRTLSTDRRSVNITLGPLNLGDTARMADSLRVRHYGREPADDSWHFALHRMTGGNPVLIEQVVAFAFASARMNALMPLDLRFDPLPGRIVDIAQTMLAPLTESQLCELAVLRQLAPIPLSHLRATVTAQTLAALRDCGALMAATDKAEVAIGDIAARVAEDRLDAQLLTTARERIAAGLLRLAATGTPLRPRAETTCARYAAEPEAEDDCARVALQRVRRSAVLAVARSSRPAEAIPIADAVLADAEPGDSPVRPLLAQALAYDALGRKDAVTQLLSKLPAPADRKEAELVVLTVAHLSISLDQRGEPLSGILNAAADWFPGDASWLTTLGTGQALFRSMTDSSVDLSTLRVPAALPGADEDALAYRDATAAVLTALQGRGKDAVALLEQRRRSVGLDAEPNLEIYRRHVFVSIVLGQDLPAVQASVRGRLLTARWDDRQDLVTSFAVLAATLDAFDRNPDGIFANISYLAATPSVNTRVWVDLLRVVGYAMSGDVVNANGALVRLGRVPDSWAGHSFGPVRALARAMIEVAAGMPEAALRRVLRELPAAERSAPLLLPPFLELALAAGMRPTDVLARASGYAQRYDLPRMTVLLERVHDQLGSFSPRSLDALTAREREVVLLAISGESNSDIASRLHLSIRTVESHLHHARTRLGMGRAERFDVLLTASAPRGAEGR